MKTRTEVVDPSKNVTAILTIDIDNGKELDTAVSLDGGFNICGETRHEFFEKLGKLIDEYRIQKNRVGDMGINEYFVARDSFELDDASTGLLSFPCCVCSKRDRKDTDEPCRTCDHNANHNANAVWFKEDYLKV